MICFERWAKSWFAQKAEHTTNIVEIFPQQTGVQELADELLLAQPGNKALVLEIVIKSVASADSPGFCPSS